MEYRVGECATQCKGGYVIGLFACSKMPLLEEAKKGGTNAILPRPIQEAGQSIMIHGVSYGDPIFPESPNLAQEFL